MLETIFEFPFALNRHRKAALLQEREAFLTHLYQQGTSLAALRSLSAELLQIIRLLKLERLRDVEVAEIRDAAERWTRQQHSRRKARTYTRTASYFMYVAKKWMRFAGRLKVPVVPRMRFADQLEDFANWMTEERGLSPYTVRSRCWNASKFLMWFAEHHHRISDVRLRHVDEFLIMKGTNGWSRHSVSTAAQGLRSFFHHAERRGWCKAGVANAIEGPTLYVNEGLPEGPSWAEVQRLLQGVTGESRAAMRARAILPLFAIYGLRSGEVTRLLLSDFDWRAETFQVRHSKRGGAQQYPLQYEVGEAILEYVQKVRPHTPCRHLFLTLNPPYRPVGTEVLWILTSRRIRAAGIDCRHNGPHCLRHACATHLLQGGASFKEIGDLLGHRSATSTGIYAKVDVTMLRRVADFDLGGLL